MPIRVLIADDHAIFRRGLRSLLAEEHDIRVIEEAESAAAAMAAIERLGPDVVTLDIRLGASDGIQTARSISQRFPDVRVVMLTTYDDREYLLGALQAGAYAYVLKNSSYDTLAQTIRRVAAGQRLLSPDLVHHVLEEYYRVVHEQIRHDSGLSSAEIEVLRLLAAGMSTQVIAERLFWSEITVKRKIQDIVDKLDASNRVQAVAEAVRRGLI